jgi:hypothetical protein
MPQEPDHDYSPAHYASLTELEQAVLQAIATHLTGERLDPTDTETLELTFNILRPCDGCVPEEEVGENLLEDIRRKFTCIYYTAVERAVEDLKAEGLRFFDDFSFCLVTDPCYQDTTHVAVVDLRPEIRPFCYLHEYAKAWHFSFANLQDIATEVLRAQALILFTFSSLNRATRNEPQPAAQGETHGQPT